MKSGGNRLNRRTVNPNPIINNITTHPLKSKNEKGQLLFCPLSPIRFVCLRNCFRKMKQKNNINTSKERQMFRVFTSVSLRQVVTPILSMLMPATNHTMPAVTSSVFLLTPYFLINCFILFLCMDDILSVF